MASIQDAYDQWSEQYDTNANKTRDLESKALRAVLASLPFRSVLELGCGTGKNTVWLAREDTDVTALDFSPGMLEQARRKVASPRVQFMQADMTRDLPVPDAAFDLAVCSLVLEHVEQLPPLFRNISKALLPGGHVYIGELHPFKQYGGSKARYDTAEGTQVVTCFNHHVSDFTSAAQAAGLEIERLEEYFDDDDRSAVPRLLVLLLRKPAA